jgi:hypothetical protein
MARQARGGWLLPFVTASSTPQALALGEAGVPLAMPRVDAAAAGATAESAASDMVAAYAPMLRMLSKHWDHVEQCSHTNAATAACDANTTIWRRTIGSGARQVFVASLDACSHASDSLLRFQAFASLAFGARGVFWRGARRCAGLGAPRFGLLASINSRLAGWSGVFVPSYAGRSWPWAVERSSRSAAA